jgi:small conductance mechanosensitive channel
MNALIQRVNDSLLDLVAAGVQLLPAVLGAIVILLLTRYLARLIRQIVERVGARTIRSQSLKLLLIHTSHVAVWVTGLLLASLIVFPGLGLGDILALLGLGSVAIGFAFQDIFKNFLAGVLLLLREPFRIGDQIIVNEYEGMVEDIDIRTTRIRTYQGERALIPNSIVFTNAVRVLTAFPERRTDLEVGVDYNTPLPKVRRLILELLPEVEGVLTQPEPEVDIVSFGDSSIDLMVRYWTQPQIAAVRRTKTRVITAIKQAFDREAITIPYPIRSLYFYDQEQYNESLPLAAKRQPSASALQAGDGLGRDRPQDRPEGR